MDCFPTASHVIMEAEEGGERMNAYTPYGMGGYMADQAALQQRIQQMEQATQPRQIAPMQNVNWIQVAGIEGARNQIVQPGQTAWMMDNNSPMFYVKSVDGMGSATLKAFTFKEIPVSSLTAPQMAPAASNGDYVTREEFNALLVKLGERQEEKKEGTE
jgi:hypothetical protein